MLSPQISVTLVHSLELTSGHELQVSWEIYYSSTKAMNLNGDISILIGELYTVRARLYVSP